MVTGGDSSSVSESRGDAARTTGSGDDQERRVRAGLRALVDEMLVQIRSAASHEEGWEPEERRRAEADLARIMEQVRAEALATRTGR